MEVVQVQDPDPVLLDLDGEQLSVALGIG